MRILFFLAMLASAFTYSNTSFTPAYPLMLAPPTSSPPSSTSTGGSSTGSSSSGSGSSSSGSGSSSSGSGSGSSGSGSGSGSGSSGSGSSFDLQYTPHYQRLRSLKYIAM